MTTQTTRASGLLRGSAGIAVAMGVMNVATYGYTILAARLLGPQGFGAFAAFMGLLLVVGVVQLGLQATGARRIAAHPGDVHEIERAVMRVAYRAALAVAALCLLLAPVIDATLDLGGLVTAALVAVTAVPLTIMGGQAGILQGERRWYPLALLYLAAGVPRLVIGGGLLVWRPTEFLAILGVTVAFAAPVAVGWLALRRPRGERPPTTSTDHAVGEIVRETVRNSHALLAFFALSNADVLVARVVLDAQPSGLYAGGLILVKAVLFLPQFVVVIAFPSMSTEHVRLRALVQSLALVLGLGAFATFAAWVLSGLALVFIGGGEYGAIQDDLWRFAVLGTLLSLLQLLVYSVVARQSRHSVYLLWVGLAVFLLAARAADDVGDLLTAVTLVDATLVAVLLVLSLWRLRAPSPS